MKNNIGLIVLVISCAIAALLVLNKQPAVTVEHAKQIPLVQTVPIINNMLFANIKTQGTISTGKEIILLAEINSKINWVSSKMETGASFFLGDTLIKLDERDYELACIAAESNVSNAELNFKRELAESEIAEKEWNRINKGQDASDLTLRKPQLAQAQAILAGAIATAEQAKRNMERTIIVAPFNGRVRKDNVTNGSSVFSGSTLGVIYSTDFYEVRLPIADKDIYFTGLAFDGRTISAVDQLDVIFDFGTLELWSGKIIRAEPERDFQTKMVVLVAKIVPSENIENSSILSIGQFGAAVITGVELNNSIKILRTLVRNEHVWVVDSNMELRKRTVDVLRFEQDYAIVKNIFKADDRILTSRMSSLIEGMKVTLLDSK